MKLRVDKDDLELVFKALDRDENGSIEVSEFLKYIE